MHGRFAPQALEVAPMGILLKDVGVGEVKVLDGNSVRVWNVHGPPWFLDVENFEVSADCTVAPPLKKRQRDGARGKGRRA